MWFVRPDQDLADSALTVTGSAEDPSFPATNAIDPNPANPAKLTTNDGWIKFAYTAKKRFVAVALIYQYLDEDLEVYVEADNVEATLDSGAGELQVAITIPAKRLDGPTYQRWTRNALALVPDAAFLDAAGYKYIRVNIAGTNSQKVMIGRIWLPEELNWVDLIHDGGSPIPEGDSSYQFIKTTEAGVRLTTAFAGPQRSLGCAIVGTDLGAGDATVQNALAFRELWESTDSGRISFLIIPQLRGSDDLEPRLVSFDAPPERSHEQGGAQVWTFTLREDSRGIPEDPDDEAS